jgi:hypothetical protein
MQTMRGRTWRGAGNAGPGCVFAASSCLSATGHPDVRPSASGGVIEDMSRLRPTIMFAGADGKGDERTTASRRSLLRHPARRAADLPLA